MILLIILQKQSSRGVLQEKFLKISQNPQENNFAGVSF